MKKNVVLSKASGRVMQLAADYNAARRAKDYGLSAVLKGELERARAYFRGIKDYIEAEDNV